MADQIKIPDIDLTGKLKPNPKHKGSDTPFMIGRINIGGIDYHIDVFKTGTERIRYGIKGHRIKPKNSGNKYLEENQVELFKK